jgi:hypothetical protein
MLLGKKSVNYEEGIKMTHRLFVNKESTLVKSIRSLQPRSQANYNQAAWTGMELAER